MPQGKLNLSEREFERKLKREGRKLMNAMPPSSAVIVIGADFIGDEASRIICYSNLSLGDTKNITRVWLKAQKKKESN